MEYQINLTGNVAGAAQAGAAALRDEGAAATAAKAAIDDMRASAAALEANTRAASALAAALREVAKAGSAPGPELPAFSKARPDEDFVRSKWDRSRLPTYLKPDKPDKAAQASDKADDGKALDSVTKKGASAAKATKNAKGALDNLPGVVRKATVGLVAYGAALAGIHKLSDLTQMAIGWRATAQLQLLSWKATMDLRRAVRGVDAQPLVRTFTLLEKNLSQSTVTGKALSGILTRGFNAAFGGVEKFSGVLDLTMQRGVLLALQLEEAWLDLRIAAKPLGDALSILGSNISAIVGPFGAAEDEASPFTDTVRELSTVASTAAAGVRELNSALSAARNGTYFINAKQNLGLISADEAARQRVAAGAPAHSRYETDNDPGSYFNTARYRAEQAAAASAGGQDTGKATAGGIVGGLDGQAGALGEAGKTAIKNVLKGAKQEGEIHSPSALFRRDVGRQLGAGAAMGVEDKTPAMQKAGAELIPSVSSGAKGATPGALAAGGIVIQQIGPFHLDAKDGEDITEKLLAMAPELGQQILRVIAMRMGLPAPGVP